MLKKWAACIQLLPKDGSVITAKQLAARLHVSVRTIRNYVSEISKEYPDFIISTSKGYKVNFLHAEKFNRLFDNIYPDNKDKRVLFIIKKIIEKLEQGISIEEIEQVAYVSESTIRKDIPEIREKLKAFDLYLYFKDGVFKVKGEEKNIRKLLSEIIYKEFNDNILTVPALEKAFPNYDVSALKNLIIDSCKSYQFFINEYALMGIVLDFLISIDRIKHNYSATLDKDSPVYRLGEREQDLVFGIVSQMESMFQIVFNQFEIDELTLLLLGHLNGIDYNAFSIDHLEKKVSKKTLRIIDTIKNELEFSGFLDMDNPDLILFLTLHIDNLIKRLENNYLTKNPLTKQIKTNCPFIYELAILIAGLINKETGYYLNDQETAYIAIHIGGMIQMQEINRDQVNAILYFPEYYNFATKLMDKLEEKFGSSLVIKSIIANEDDLKHINKVDLILTTIELDYDNPDVEVVKINPFLNAWGKIVIESSMNKIIKRKNKKYLEDTLLEISSKDLFYLDKNWKHEEEAIVFLAEQMVDQGYAAPTFVDEVIEREKRYATSYGNIAVPHSQRMDQIKTGMSICINTKPTPWGEHKVNIILLFSVNPEDKGRFYEIFEQLIVLLLEPEYAEVVKNSKTYDEFISNLLSCL